MPAPIKKTIDIQEAIRSALRLWLVTRDQVLWCFCMGTGQECLEKVDIAPAQEMIDQMNSLRALALKFAEQLASDGKSTPQGVIRGIVDQLIAEERPKFPLSTESVPGSF